MKKLHKTFAFVASLALLAGGLFVSCGDDDNSDEGVKVSLNKTTLSLAPNAEETLTATVTGATDTSVTWSSSDAAVATVADGKVTAVKVGTATITATSKEDTSKKATCAVTVAEASPSGEGGTGWLWTTKGYTKTDCQTSTDNKAVAFGEETACGNVTAGKNVKEARIDKNGKLIGGNAGTIAAEAEGYFQLSNGADGSVWFTAPAGTTKVTVCAKLDASTKQIILKTNATSTSKSVELGKVVGASGNDYKDHVFNVQITEETVVYVGTFASSVTANLKAIKIE